MRLIITISVYGILLLAITPLLAQSGADILEIENLLADGKKNKSDVPLSQKFYKKAVIKADSLNLDSLCIEALFKLGRTHTLAGENKAFFELMKKYLKPESVYNSNKKRYAYLMGLYAGAYTDMFEYDKALEYLLKEDSIKKANGIKKHKFAASLNNNIAEIYARQGLFSRSNKYALDGYIEAEASESKFNLSFASIILTDNYYAIDSFNLASDYFSKFLELMDFDNKDLRFKSYHYGESFSTLDGVTDFNKLIDLYNTVSNKTDASKNAGNHIAFTIAEKYIAIGDWESAISYWKKGLNLDTENKSVEINQHGLYSAKKLFDAYLHLGVKDSVIYYSNLCDSLNQKRFSQASMEKVDELVVKYDTAQKDAQIVEQKIKQNRLIASLIILGLLSTLILFYVRSKQKQTKKEMLILKQNQKLMALDYMFQGQQEERKRIAQDLHDGIGGILAVAKMQMQNIQKEINKMQSLNLFDKTEALINNAYSEVRRISHDMMPGSLIDLGLFAAVDDLADNVNAGSELKVITEWYTEDSGLNEKQSVVMYRIIQEAINNAVKYAQAEKLVIQLTKNPEGYNLTIEDDGVGFRIDDAAYKNGLGLKSIQSRVDYLNGEMKLQSELGKGTCYDILIPV